MSLKGIAAFLGQHPELQRHFAEIDGNGRYPEISIRQGARPAYLAALRSQRRQPILVLTPRPDDARTLHDQLLTYLGEDAPVFLFPESDVLPFERLAVDSRTTDQRLAALSALGNPQDSENPSLVVASVPAALRCTLSPEIFHPAAAAEPGNLHLTVGQRIPRLDQLLSCWVDLGYRHEPLVESPGCFSHRGGIIDVFPPNCDLPARIELWDDEVETIRSFDPYTQRSVDNLGAVSLIPAREQLPHLADQETMDSLIAQMDSANCRLPVRERFKDDLAEIRRDPDMETLHFYNGLLNRSHLLQFLPPVGLLALDRPGQIEAEALDQEEKYLRMKASRKNGASCPATFLRLTSPGKSFPGSSANGRVPGSTCGGGSPATPTRFSPPPLPITGSWSSSPPTSRPPSGKAVPSWSSVSTPGAVSPKSWSRPRLRQSRLRESKKGNPRSRAGCTWQPAWSTKAGKSPGTPPVPG